MVLGGGGNVLLHLTTRGKEGAGTISIDVEELELCLNDDGAGDVITSTEGFFVLLVGEDILTGDHGLGGAVLTGLGSGHLDDLAGENFLHHEEGTGLSSSSFLIGDVGGTSIGLLELVIRHR